MRAIFLAAIVAIVVTSAAVWLHRPSHPAPVNASLYENDMIEALVRCLLNELTPPPPSVCFLAFGDGTTPPDPNFIARFVGTQPVIRGCDSAASPPVGKYFDTATGQPGIVIHIIQFRQFAPGAFDVLVEFSNQPPGHDRFTYRMIQTAGHWVIIRQPPA